MMNINNFNEEIPKNLLKLKIMLNEKGYRSYFTDIFPSKAKPENNITLKFFDDILEDDDIFQYIINTNRMTLFQDIEIHNHFYTGEFGAYYIKGKYVYIEKI